MTAPDRNGCTVGRAGYWISQFAGINRHHNQWGRLIFQIFGALAEFERNLIRERTQAGLTAARARGRKGGRPKSLDAKKTELAYQLYDEKKHTIKEICQMLGISKPSLYAYLVFTLMRTGPLVSQKSGQKKKEPGELLAKKLGHLLMKKVSHPPPAFSSRLYILQSKGTRQQ